MDLRQRTTIATDPFATIKGIGSLTLRAEQYADLDAPSVARSVSVERTLQTLVNLSAQAHPLETSTLKGAREGVDGEEQRHLTAPRFYLLDLALRVWSETTYAHLPDRRFVDLTGSNGENCVAASLLRDWVSCRSIEPIPEARVLAKALVDERDKRHNRRRRGASRRGREPQKPPAQVYIEEASCLWNCDWYDCDVALFDATRPAFSAFVDEGAFVRAALWPGLARCAEGTVVCLISRDPNPTVRRAELIPTEGPSACELLDSCVIACGDGGTAEALRADIVKTIAPSSDPRLVQRREQSKTTGLLLKVQDAHRASLRRNVTEFQLGSPSDESSWGSTPTPQKSPTLGIVRQRKFGIDKSPLGSLRERRGSRDS